MLLGILVWPFQNMTWDVPTRVDRFVEHYRTIDGMPKYALGVDEKLVLADLSEYSSDASIVLDTPIWAIRDGALSISLFVGRFRAYSLSFTLRHASSDGLTCYIGGIQGRQGNGSLAMYRQMTRDFHGLRPRDLMIEVARSFCRSLQVRKLMAVGDDARYQQHAFFGSTELARHYDDIWKDRGGVEVAPAEFLLPLKATRRAVMDIPSKKKAMYSRRYLLLDRLAEMAETGFPQSRVTSFDAE